MCPGGSLGEGRPGVASEANSGRTLAQKSHEQVVMCGLQRAELPGAGRRVGCLEVATGDQERTEPENTRIGCGGSDLPFLWAGAAPPSQGQRSGELCMGRSPRESVQNEAGAEEAWGSLGCAPPPTLAWD